jgi:hypothetical protein
MVEESVNVVETRDLCSDADGTREGAPSSSRGRSTPQLGVLDPLTCIPKRNQKYASECTQVYLANKDAELLSENFCKFPNLEVVWFNMNHLTRLENLEHNFRIREVFVQDNRLVSLSGLKNCKFLRVLLASNNQIRNLEKQLAFISRFHFLKKLELSGNPIADEPEYRLRLIYHAPQVEIFDCAVVKGPERIKADDIVPNLDKVSGPPPKKDPMKKSLSLIERDVFRETRQIHKRRKEADELALTQCFTSTLTTAAKVVQHKQFATNKQAWSTPREFIAREKTRPTAWEKRELLEHVEKLAGKEELNRSDVQHLCNQLATEGVADMGRSLVKPDILDQLVVSGGQPIGIQKATTSSLAQQPVRPNPLDPLKDPDATLPTKVVASYLVTMDWHRHNESKLSHRIAKLYDDAKRADLSGNKAEQSLCQTTALRLEGVKDRMKDHQSMIERDELLLGSARKPRADVFHQTFLRPQRLIDELTGRGGLQVSARDRCTSLGG